VSCELLASGAAILAVVPHTFRSNDSGDICLCAPYGSSPLNYEPVNFLDLWGLKATDDFSEFMDFLSKQGVERTDVSEPFRIEKIADDWMNLPESVREYEPENLWGKFVDDMGNHEQNQRLPGGYHVTVDDGSVYVHYDVHDANAGPKENIKHVLNEVINDPGSKFVDDKPDWGAQ